MLHRGASDAVGSHRYFANQRQCHAATASQRVNVEGDEPIVDSVESAVAQCFHDSVALLCETVQVQAHSAAQQRLCGVLTESLSVGGIGEDIVQMLHVERLARCQLIFHLRLVFLSDDHRVGAGVEIAVISHGTRQVLGGECRQSLVIDHRCFAHSPPETRNAFLCFD